MTAALVATALATPPVALAAWWLFQLLTSPPPGRHRHTGSDRQVRPSALRSAGPVVIPGPADPDATGVLDVRDLTAPVPLPARQQAPIGDIDALMNALTVAVRNGAFDEETREVTRIQ